MEKIVFVILHYQAIKQTINCINSIKEKLNEQQYEIVVVDNNSTNGTGKELNDLYNKDSKVHIILNKENLGFARGNNIGFKYAKEELKADFISMINNDTCIIQNDFFELIKQEYAKSNFAVLGPKIILLNNEINPLITKELTIKNVKKEKNILYVSLLFNYLHIEDILIFIKEKIKKHINKDKETLKSVNERHENIILHGCCLIFSPTYIEKFDGLDDRTFLYHEEELLYIRLKRNKMLSVYNPNLMIFHEEDAATNSISKSKNKKRRFIYKNLIKSDKILIKELEEYRSNENG